MKRISLAASLTTSLATLGWAAVLGCSSFGCSSPSAGTRPHDGGMDVPIPRRDAQPIDYDCPADATGGGNCPLNFCGTLQTASTLAANPSTYAQSGADSLCNDGHICVVGALLPSGDAFQLTCVPPAAGAQPFGKPCSPNGGAGMQCGNNSLCVPGPDSTTASPDLFCATMCRNDADCPTAAICLEYPATPGGPAAQVGLCTPISKTGGTPCTHEGACPSGQGCVPFGARTSLTVCKATGGSTVVGKACTGNGDCLSGACFDQTFKQAGGGNQTFCSSVCTVNSDCGPDQICTRLVLNNNGTPNDPTDDVVVGQCQTLFAPTGGCTSDAGCVALNNGSDTCDKGYGVCYNKSAVPGSACTKDTNCMLGGVCSTGARFPGGYCQSFGCAPNPTGSTPNIDLCPGAGSICAQRGGPDAPLYSCYEGCVPGSDAAGQTCDRSGYACSSPVSNAPANICLGQFGT